MGVVHQGAPVIYTVTAGHGGSDPGAVAHGAQEAALMTELRNVIRHKLEAAGHKVRTDGMRLANLPLVHALTLVPGSAVAIELHTNAFTNPAATGVECISMPEQKARAQRIAAGIARVLEIPLRGDRGWIDQRQSARGRLAFVRVGGIVVETFFISNPMDLHKYDQRKWLVASAIVEAMTS